MKKLLAYSFYDDYAIEKRGRDIYPDPLLDRIIKHYNTKGAGLSPLVLFNGTFEDREAIVHYISSSLTPNFHDHRFILDSSGNLVSGVLSDREWNKGSYISNTAWIGCSAIIIGLVLLSYNYESDKLTSLSYFKQDEACPENDNLDYTRTCLTGPYFRDLSWFEQWGRSQNGPTLFDQPFYPLFLLFLFQGFIAGANAVKHILFSRSEGASVVKDSVTWALGPLDLDELRGRKQPLQLGFIRSAQDSIGVVPQLSSIDTTKVDGFFDTLVAGNSTFNWADSSSMPIKDPRSLLIFFSTKNELAQMRKSGLYDRRFSSGRYQFYNVSTFLDETEKTKLFIDNRIRYHFSKSVVLSKLATHDELLSSLNTRSLFKHPTLFTKHFYLWNQHIETTLAKAVRKFESFFIMKQNDRWTTSENRELFKRNMGGYDPFETVNKCNDNLLEITLKMRIKPSDCFLEYFLFLIEKYTPKHMLDQWKHDFINNNGSTISMKYVSFQTVFEEHQRDPFLVKCSGRWDHSLIQLAVFSGRNPISNFEFMLDVDPFALLIGRENFTKMAINYVDDYILQLKEWIKNPGREQIKNPIIIIADKHSTSLSSHPSKATYGIAKSTSARAMFLYLKKRIKEENLEYGIKLLRDQNHAIPTFYTEDKKESKYGVFFKNRAVELTSFLVLETFMLFTKLAADSYRNFLYTDFYNDYWVNGEPGVSPAITQGPVDIVKGAGSPFDDDPDYGWYRVFKEINFGWALYGITFCMGIANLILSAYIDKSHRKEDPSILLPLTQDRDMVTVYESDTISDLEGGYDPSLQPQDRVMCSGKESKLAQSHGGMIFVENLDDTNKDVLETLVSVSKVGQFKLGHEISMPYTGIVFGCTNHLDKVPSYFRDNADVILELDPLMTWSVEKREKKEEALWSVAQMKLGLTYYQQKHHLKPLSSDATELFINTVFSQKRDRCFTTRIFFKNWLEGADLIETGSGISEKSLKEGWVYMKSTAFESNDTHSLDWIDAYLNAVHEKDESYDWKKSLLVI